jgi:SAM-dependent methyltransferase
VTRADREQERWNAHTLRILERAYLDAPDPRAGSGFRGDAERWERARRVVMEAVEGDGTFLDVGCANGLLMESVAGWAAEDGYVVEPYGLELSPAIAALARRRLPHWAARIHVGDVTTWEPPRRYRYVRVSLDCAPPPGRGRLIRRCLDRLVEDGGRLVVCSYGSARRPEPRAEDVAALLASWGHDVVGAAEAADTNGVVITRVAWVDRQGS